MQRWQWRADRRYYSPLTELPHFLRSGALPLSISALKEVSTAQGDLHQMETSLEEITPLHSGWAVQQHRQSVLST
jgi:hypothetical protein